MQDQKTIYAKDYQQPAFYIDKTFLSFALNDGITVVSSRLEMRRNPAFETDLLILDGQDLELRSIKIDGVEIPASSFLAGIESIVITLPPVKEHFTFECVTAIYPEKNTSLEGLYRSRGMFCTQCEAEGFRKITYYLDRPDVMSEFHVTLVAEKNSFPVMLSNGNCIADIIENDLRVVTWHDPFKKPCYLFALVAGDLACLEDVFVTQSGRKVALEIFVETKDLDKCDHAMHSLKNAMRWDEQVYGREYDLDTFMIVAVDDFNMGAMENKGLNIFNTSCVLANPKTTTDDGFERVEAIVAHEYFHNWSGNRVTCRDWFQLSLKEGFTVFRDAEFSADMNSRDVKRIEDAIFLRSVQFAEDAGPMAHPVRPDSYIEISNFYTVTIYEKGAEVVRMLANILGKDLFRKATDLYFDRHDGQAVTCEDFVRCMEDASGIDFQQFRLWYTQAGTPELKVTDHYEQESHRYHLTIEQITPATPGQENKMPFHIPVKIALYGDAGALPLHFSGSQFIETPDNTERVLDVIQQKNVFIFDNVFEKPVPSLLRGFSAPVKVDYAYTDQQLAHLIAIDTDGFSRWDACQALATKVIMNLVDNIPCQSSLALLTSSLGSLLENDAIDKAMLALMFTLPTDAYIAEFYDSADPGLIFNAKNSLRLHIARTLRSVLLEIYQQCSSENDGTSYAARSSRSLGNMALSYLMLLEEHGINQLCWQQFTSSSTMTEQLASLKYLVNSTSATDEACKALDQFYDQWKNEALVVNMWLQVQASCEKDGALSRVRALLQHEAFDYTNPNKVRSVVATFCSQNPAQFHQVSGDGYDFLADQVIYLDKVNPQIASRLLTPLTRWRRIEPVRSVAMKKVLERIAASQLSKDVYEIVSKSLVI
jgi:aminopeptidase N